MSQLERIFFINDVIKKRGGITAGEVALQFEVSDRQVKRDIEYMRDRLGTPIEWTACRKRYEYAYPWDDLSFADEKAFLTFAFLDAILTDYHYIPVVSERIVKSLKKWIAGPYAEIIDKVRYELSDMEPIRGEIAYVLCRALLLKKRIEIDYTDAKGEESSRSIAPVRIVNYSGKWYCAALDSKTAELRTFALSRMRNVRLTDKSAGIIPTNEKVEAFLSSSYGIFKGKPLGIATLRFSGGAARAVREQVWHKDQSIRELPSPENEPIIELSLPAHDWTELLGRALRCGSQCEVIGPAEFRERWREEIRKMGEKAEGR
jgi:predicted DNA-binding transcriptional regulator YafY